MSHTRGTGKCWRRSVRLKAHLFRTMGVNRCVAVGPRCRLCRGTDSVDLQGTTPCPTFMVPFGHLHLGHSVIMVPCAYCVALHHGAFADQGFCTFMLIEGLSHGSGASSCAREHLINDAARKALADRSSINPNSRLQAKLQANDSHLATRFPCPLLIAFSARTIIL